MVESGRRIVIVGGVACGPKAGSQRTGRSLGSARSIWMGEKRPAASGYFR